MVELLNYFALLSKYYDKWTHPIPEVFSSYYVY